MLTLVVRPRSIPLFASSWRALPLMTRASYGREIKAWSLLAVPVGAIEGGVAGVLVKNVFAGAVPRGPLNFTMAVISGAGLFANLLGVVWTSIGQGRDKIRQLVKLQILTICTLGLIALVPVSPWGLVLFVLAAGGGRVLWAGVIAIRSPVWRANYARESRARITGGFVTADSLFTGLTALAIGSMLEGNPTSFRWIYPLAALVGLTGALIFRRVRVQGHRALLEAEQANEAGRASIAAFVDILRTDRPYALYLACMFVFGGGNIMLTGPLIAVMHDNLHIGARDQMLVTVTLPMLTMPLGIPFWARRLDRRHIIEYRKLHSWSFVWSGALLSIAAIANIPLLLWLGSAALGFAMAGGQLGGSLGHNDFCGAGRATHYMGLHMTLTGIRGFISPLLGITAYQLLEAHRPGTGPFALLVPLSLTVAGAIGFFFLARAYRSREGWQQPKP